MNYKDVQLNVLTQTRLKVDSYMFDYMVFPVLESPRLLLREMNDNDAEGILQIRGDYEVTKYNSGMPITNRLEAKMLIDSIAGDFRQQLSIRWGLVLKSSGALVGLCGYNYWDRANMRASVGYDLARAYWGRGLMPEALRCIVQFGFDEMNLNRIEADCTSLNTASARVLEKVGFKNEGLQREQYFENGQFYDLLLFGLLRRDFQP